MYRCQVCGEKSKPRQNRRVHNVYREVPDRDGKTRQEIAQEVPVCEYCDTALREGYTLEQLRKVFRNKRDQALISTAPAAPAGPVVNQPVL